jgi:hypothetical protein
VLTTFDSGFRPVDLVSIAPAHMKKEKRLWEGSLDHIPENQIYLNINHLENGSYVLKIVYRDKVIKEITFEKPNTC